MWLMCIKYKIEYNVKAVSELIYFTFWKLEVNSFIRKKNTNSLVYDMINLRAMRWLRDYCLYDRIVYQDTEGVWRNESACERRRCCDSDVKVL